MPQSNAARQISISFPLGRLLITPGAQEALRSCETSPMDLLYRHQSGDWGDICPEDRGENERALKQAARIVSVYHLYETIVWVITEADRSATTILLPEEY
jgi:hypothetical protein